MRSVDGNENDRLEWEQGLLPNAPKMSRFCEPILRNPSLSKAHQLLPALSISMHIPRTTSLLFQKQSQGVKHQLSNIHVACWKSLIRNASKALNRLHLVSRALGESKHLGALVYLLSLEQLRDPRCHGFYTHVLRVRSVDQHRRHREKGESQ